MKIAEISTFCGKSPKKQYSHKAGGGRRADHHKPSATITDHSKIINSIKYFIYALGVSIQAHVEKEDGMGSRRGTRLGGESPPPPRLLSPQIGYLVVYLHRSPESLRHLNHSNSWSYILPLILACCCLRLMAHTIASGTAAPVSWELRSGEGGEHRRVAGLQKGDNNAPPAGFVT